MVKSKNNSKRVAKVAAPSVGRGRPALVLKYPRKQKFTIKDVMKLNNVSVLTVRNRLKQVAKVVAHLPREGQGHPEYQFALN